MDTYFDKHINQVIEALTKIDHQELQRVEDIFGYVRSEGGRVWLAGNGGSAATASHFTNDLVKMCGIQAFCLSDMTPLATAFGNDDGWENMYSGLVEKLEGPLDAVIGITCSGNSKNIVEFLAKSAATWKIVLTGDNMESAVSNMISLDAILRAENPDIRVQEDVHSVLCHALAGRLSCR